MPPRVGYRKSDRLLFLNMLKNSSRSKTVVPWSSWSSEGPLKVHLSRPPWSFRIASVALFRVSCVVSTERKHPTLTRSLDDKDDHGNCILACFKTADDHFSEAIQDDNRADKEKYSSGKIWSRSGRLESNTPCPYNVASDLIKGIYVLVLKRSIY